MEKIDLKDRKILYELDLDSRQSFRSIGRKVGLSKDLVASRVKKLEEQGIIVSYITVIDPIKLGYFCFRFYISFQNTTPEIKEDIINYFINNKSVIVVASLRGEYDLLIFSLFQNMDGFFSFWRKTLIKYRNYFQKQVFSAYNQYRIYKYRFLLGDEANKFCKFDEKENITISGGEKVDTDNLDFQILKLLSVNARLSTVEIAEKLKSNTKTISDRIKKLKDLDVIQGYRIYLDHFTLDYYYYKANIQLTDYVKRASIIDYIIKNPALFMIDESAGFVDLELNFIVEDTKHFHQIMEDLNTKFPNSIKGYNYFYAEKFHKLQYIPEE